MAVSISKKRVVTLPATIQPGVSQFHVTTAAKESGFQVALPAAGYTIEQAVNDIDKGLEQGKIKPLKRFEANVTLLGGVTATPDVPGTLWVTLAAGSYWAVDINANKAEAFTPFTVAGLDTGNVDAGERQGEGRRQHEVEQEAEVDPEQGTADLPELRRPEPLPGHGQAQEGQDPPGLRGLVPHRGSARGSAAGGLQQVPEHAASSAPGISQTVNYKLPKGNYVMLCFWPDASMGGMPHAFMGMIPRDQAEVGTRAPGPGASHTAQHRRCGRLFAVRIWRDVSEVPDDLGRTVVTIGNFDGVHRGHQRVVRRAREVASETGADRVVVVTFDPHPFAVLRPEHAPLTLSTIEGRLALLAEAGADDALVHPVQPGDRRLVAGGVRRPDPRRRPARPRRRGRRQLPLRPQGRR